MLQLGFRRKKNTLGSELTYASHHHLIPLYALGGTAITAVLVLACFVTVLWQNSQTEALKPAIQTAVNGVEGQYIAAAVSPAEKKQYVYPANVRFAITDPYNTFRYSFDPGMAGTATSASIQLTTNADLQNMERAALQNPQNSGQILAHLQQCKTLYVIRFIPGVTPYGGFVPLKDVKLKDGRTAYIHKNSQCIPATTQDMDTLDNIEAAVLSIESY